MLHLQTVSAFAHDQKVQDHHLALPTSNQSILKQDLQTLPHQKLSFRGNLKNDEENKKQVTYEGSRQFLLKTDL